MRQQHATGRPQRQAWHANQTQMTLQGTTRCYYKVLQVLHSSTRCYKLVHQYYSVPQSTTPILRCTTKYYSLYYKVRICKARSNRCHPPTSPNIAPATQNDSHDWSFSHMKRHLQCAEQQDSPSNVTKCCACHAKWLSWLILVTYEMSFTMRRATGLILQRHQILHLPRKIARMIDVRHMWNVIYNARSNRCHPPTSPNAAPATQNDSPKSKKNSLKTVEVAIAMRGRFDHESEHELVISHPPVRGGSFLHFGDAFCIENYNISRSGYLPRFHRILRLPQKVTLQDHQILLLPRKMTLMIDVRRTWHVIYNARSNRSHPPTSPNAAPATQNDSHHLSSWHMKRYLQCAEQQASPSKFTKCCACHVKWLSCLMSVTCETSFTMRGATGVIHQRHQMLRLPRKMTVQNLRKTLWKQLKWQLQCGDDSTMNPSMNSSSRTRPFAEVPFRTSETHFVLKITTFRAPAIYPDFTEYCACHKKWHSKITKYCSCHAKWLSWLMSVTHDTSFTMRGATDLILQHHQMLRLPRKMTRIIYPRDIWNVIYNARSSKHHLPSSPNAAPAT